MDEKNTVRFCCCINVHIKLYMFVVYILSMVASVAFILPWLRHSDVLPLGFVILACVNAAVMVVTCSIGIHALRNEMPHLGLAFFVGQTLNILVAVAECALFVYIISMPETVKNRYERQYAERYGEPPSADAITFDTYKALNQYRFVFYFCRNIAAIVLSAFFMLYARQLYAHLTIKRQNSLPMTSITGNVAGVHDD